METAVLVCLSVLSILIGMSGVYMTMLKFVPVRLVYYMNRVRLPLAIVVLLVVWGLTFFWLDQWSWIGYFSLILAILGVFLAYRLTQERMFIAVDFPDIIEVTTGDLLPDDSELAVIEYNGVVKCYPLDYVIHYHIINDWFGSKMVSLTYCAMCRSIIPFDVTAIGPLYVSSFKHANMIVSDRKTGTFFQQANFESLVGKLHPSELIAIPFQIVTWREVKNMFETPVLPVLKEGDLKPFELPIKGLWKRIVVSEFTPGLSSKNRDKTFAARTRVIGIVDKINNVNVVYLKQTILNQGLVVNETANFFLVAHQNNVTAFRWDHKQDLALDLSARCITADNGFQRWDLNGKYLSGDKKQDLVLIRLSDEYWFSWKRFHPNTQFIDL
ncbi:DUF3179 domain-containing protein [Myroides odoratimimus]|uniref:DUF3179 domain-containing (seleno)protein n=1 Tax=Myroides odoratimimus TaxID=76832 RepID=UPI002577273B|nr:DUF3179 domain-containing (seleno)protein [Myroides odoratimimus]MDM1461370.1 DUF3179 domain-containing protein [Myroides odoratimimus]